MSVNYGKIVRVFGKEAPVMQRWTVLKVFEAREELGKLISQGWRVTQEVWNKPSDNYILSLLGISKLYK